MLIVIFGVIFIPLAVYHQLQVYAFATFYCCYSKAIAAVVQVELLVNTVLYTSCPAVYYTVCCFMIVYLAR
jgi:hypothetical protein